MANKRHAPARRIDTLSVHAGRGDLREIGVHAPPLDLSSTYPLDDLDQAVASLDALVAGAAEAASPVYSRLHSPTVARFEQALAELEGTSQAVAFSSGMAALTACLLVARQAGGHVVAIRPLYGGSDHLLASALLGLEVTWARPDEVGAAIRPDTSLVLLETPANPTMALADIADVVRQAGDAPVLVDSTFATPILQHPAALGATLVLHSATKFLGGHGDVLAGVVATDDGEWARKLRQVRIATGAVLHPLGAYLLHRSLPTLPLRIDKAQSTAYFLVRRLLEHPGVTKVLYPGLEASNPDSPYRRQMAGPGALFAFEVKGGYESAHRLLSGLELITPAVSLGATDTLIQHPAGLTHRVVDERVKRESGISDGLLRVSVGLEHPDDLWADLSGALARALTTRARALAG